MIVPAVAALVVGEEAAVAVVSICPPEARKSSGCFEWPVFWIFIRIDLGDVVLVIAFWFYFISFVAYLHVT